MITDKKFFDNWAADYDNYLPRLPQYRRLISFMVNRLRLRENSSVLDVGVGTGFLATSILRKYRCNMHGIDISSKMLRGAAKNARQLGYRIKLAKGNARNLKIGTDRFDAIVSAYVLHHLSDLDKIRCFAKIRAGLKDGGLFIIGDMFVQNECLGPERMKEVTKIWTNKSAIAFKCVGKGAAKLELDHISLVYFKDGEYIIPVHKWERCMKKAGFGKIGHKIIDTRTADFVLWGQK